MSIYPEDLSGAARQYLASRDITRAPLQIQRDLVAALTGRWATPEEMPEDARNRLTAQDLLAEAIGNHEVPEDRIVITQTVPLHEGEEVEYEDDEE